MKVKSGNWLTDSGVTLLQVNFLNQVIKDYEAKHLSPKELKSILNGVVLQNLDSDYLYEMITASSRAQEANEYWKTHTKEMSAR